MLRAAGAASSESDGSARVSTRTRLFVYAFLAAFLTAGLAGIEAWPLTGWRLFSHVRTERSAALSAMIIDATGRERPLPFGSMPTGFRWGPNVLGSFGSMTPAEQIGICDAWATGVRRLGIPVMEVRIYRVERVVSRRDGDRGTPPVARTPAYVCGDGAIRVEEAARGG